MTKIYKFNNNNTTTSKNFFPKNTAKSYSEIIDDIILADIAKKNDYLFKTNLNKATSISSGYYTPIYSSSLKDSDFAKAAKFLANYKSYKKAYKLPYILGKMYELSDGTPIIFYDDEIQIGFDTYKYDDFSNISFLNLLSTPKKKIIINIFSSANADININLL